MQNLIQLEDEVKGLPDQALQQLAQTPNAQLPQFLVVSEIQRRSDMRKRYEGREGQPQGTVAQQIVNPQPQGIASMMPQQAAPQGGPMQQPMQPPMQQPMQQLAGAPTGQPMPPQTMGMYGGGIVSMLEGRKATFPMNEVPPQSSIIGQRINNPFNIRQANQGFVGESGDESGFVSFDDPMYGVRAADRVLSTYGRDYGINSIRGLLNRYAPPEDDNDTESYISYVSNKLGVDPDAEIDLSNPEVRSQVLSPIAMFESRSEYSPGQITEMITSANERGRPMPPAQAPAGLASQADLPELRESIVTSESVDLPVLGQEPPLSKDVIQKRLAQDAFDRTLKSAKSIAKEKSVTGAQTTSELMAALFGSQSRAGSEKEAASERLLEMADKVNVDTKGLITTDNQPNNAIKEDARTGAGAAGPVGKEVVADVVRDLSQMPLANRLAMERKGQTAGTSDDERRMQQAQRYASLIQGGPSARRVQTGDSAEALAAQLAARESELSPQETTSNNLGDVADQMKQAYMQPDEAGTLGSPDSTPGVKGVYERLIEQFESKTPEASAIEERAEVVSQIQRGYATQREVEERAARVGGVVDPEMKERSDASMLRLSERLSKLDSQIESGDFSEPEAPQKRLSDSELALTYGGGFSSGMAGAEREEAEAMAKPQGTYNQVKRQENRANKIALAEEIDKKQVEIQAYRDDYDTTNPAVIKEVAKREAEIARLSRELGSLSGAEQKGGDDAQAVDPEKAAVTQTADEASSAAMDQAAAFLAQAKAQRDAGLITKEDLAKKEALGAALIQLGAGIAGGDLAGGLSKAGIAAQDVREKARDRALRARYYDSVATNRSSSGQTLEQKRIIDNVDAAMEGATDPATNGPYYTGSPEYQAERARRILEQGAKLNVDMSSYISGAMPVDPTASAAGRATPGESVSFSDLQL